MKPLFSGQWAPATSSAIASGTTLTSASGASRKRASCTLQGHPIDKQSFETTVVEWPVFMTGGLQKRDMGMPRNWAAGFCLEVWKYALVWFVRFVPNKGPGISNLQRLVSRTGKRSLRASAHSYSALGFVAKGLCSLAVCG